jgi:hypothetical protein
LKEYFFKFIHFEPLNNLQTSRANANVILEKMDSITHLVEQEGVPKMFFETYFELENEYKQIFTKEALLTSRLLQEKVIETISQI